MPRHFQSAWHPPTHAYAPMDEQKPTVWQEFTPLAAQVKAVNLGQGFPDWPTPSFCKSAAINAIESNLNQYCRSGGLPALTSALAHHYSPLFERELNAEKEVTVSVGVSEGLFAAIHSLVNPGDEVILIEPAFDIYAAQVGNEGRRGGRKGEGLAFQVAAHG